MVGIKEVYKPMEELKQIKNDITQLKKDIKELKITGDIPYDIEKAFRERLGDIQPTTAIADANITTTISRTVTITIPSGGGTDSDTITFDTLDVPDGWIQIKVNGQIRKIPYYND